MDLNPEQQQAVTHGKGPLRIIALAGSGKTSALVERVVHLVKVGRVSTDQILMITFSRTAREQMERRINKRLPTMGAGKCARTFHSIGLMIFNAERRASADEFTIDTSGFLYKRAATQACRAFSMEPCPALVERLASTVKNGMLAGNPTLHRLGRVDPKLIKASRQVVEESASTVHPDRLVELFLKTEQIRAIEGVHDRGGMQRFVTFDDMIHEAATMLQQQSVREAWAKRWRYVLCDEAQDVNAAQMAIANALVSVHRNYTIVGDPGQSIFGFRGTSPQTILRFDERYPEAATVLMHRNYRSGIEICDLATRILDSMPANSVVTDGFGHAAAMRSERQTHAYIGCHGFGSPRAEAEAIADNIVAHRAADVPWEEQAVLVRMNRMTREIEIALALRGIPCRLASGNSFFTMPEATCLFGYLRLIAGRTSADAVKAAMRHPSRKLRRKFIDLVAESHKDGEGWLDTMRRVAAKDGKPHEQRAVHAMAKLIEAERDDKHKAPGAKAGRLRHLLKLDEYFGGEVEDTEDSRSQDNLNDVVEFIAAYDSLDDLIDTIVRVEGHQQRTGAKRKAVKVCTVHKAKGDEWDVVYVPRLESGLFPSARADRAEERRVFYVAATRARDELWLSWSHSTREPQRSVFLDECELQDSETYEPGRKVEDERVGAQARLF